MIKIKLININESDTNIFTYHKNPIITLTTFIRQKLLKIPTNKLNDKLHLINIIRTKIFNLKKIKPPENIIYNFMFNIYLKKLGNYNLIKHSINTYDLDTQCDIFSISPFYIYCLKDKNDVYTFDIRTLYLMYLLDNKTNKNPYTQNIINCNNLLHIKKKIDFLIKHNINVYHFSYLKRLNDKEVNMNNIIYNLHLLDYDINKLWIINLSCLKLKKLYYCLYNNWTFANLDDVYKNNIINLNNGVLFDNYKKVESFKPKQKNELINIIFNILNRLISEGSNNDFKKIGALYFLSSLVEISVAARNVYYFLL